MPSLPALPPTLMHLQADAYVQACQETLGTGMGADSMTGAWQIDASPLHDFDSAALAALLEVSRLVHRVGGELHIVDMPQRLRDLSALYGVSELLPA